MSADRDAEAGDPPFDEEAPSDDKDRQESPAVPKQTANPDETVFQYAHYYAQAYVGNDEELIERRRELLFLQLEGYRHFLHIGSEPSWEMQTWTPLQRTIRYASDQADIYLDHHDPEEVVELIIQDMVEEQRNLPRGVAEWVVERVAESEGDQE